MNEATFAGLRYTFLACSVVTAVENFVAIVMFATARQLRLNSYGFVLTLALADLSCATGAVALIWKGQSDAHFVTVLSTLLVSVFTVLSIATSRMLAMTAVRTTHFEGKESPCRLVGYFVVVWCVAFMTYIFPLFVTENEPAMAILMKGLVGQIVLVTIGLILYAVFQKLQALSTGPVSSRPYANDAAVLAGSYTPVSPAKRLFVALVILLTAFVSFMPWVVVEVAAHHFNTTELLQDENFIIVFWVVGLFYCGSTVINPVIYWDRVGEFGRNFRQLFCACRMEAADGDDAASTETEKLVEAKSVLAVA